MINNKWFCVMSLAFLPALSSCIIEGDFDLGHGPEDCKYSDSRHDHIDSRGIKKIVINSRSASLRVMGHPEHVAAEKGIMLTSEICTSRSGQLEKARLRVERYEDLLIVDVDVSAVSGRVEFDLLAEIPDTVAVEINDSSGEIAVQNLAGNLEVTDGSGDINIFEIGGTITITDGSGDVRVVFVGEDVLIRSDGSGDLFISSVTGSVIIQTDGSGDIHVWSVGGDFIVESDGSGSINYGNIGGVVQLP